MCINEVEFTTKHKELIEQMTLGRKNLFQVKD